MSPRLQYLIDHYGQKLVSQLSRESITLNPEEAVLKFCLSDPTRHKSATQWIITTYLKNGFLFEDLAGIDTSKVYETLAMFGLYRKHLEPEMRSLNKYKTLGDLWHAVEQFIPKETEIVSLEGRALKRAERERAYAETEFIFKCETSGFTIVSPKTEFASCWWGKGTRWCTASKKNNMFSRYNAKGPLFILTMPNADKLQLHLGKYVHLMNAQDRNPTQDYIKSHWLEVKNFMYWIISKNSETFQLVPNEFLDRKICLDTVKQDGRILDYVLDRFRDKELYWEAVKQNGKILKSVPYEHRDKEICLRAILTNGMALEYIPENHKDKMLCLKAVEQNSMAIQYVPEHMKSFDLCWLAVKQDIRALSHISSNVYSEKFYQKAYNYHKCNYDNEFDLSFTEEHVLIENYGNNRKLSEVIHIQKRKLINIQNIDHADIYTDLKNHLTMV